MNTVPDDAPATHGREWCPECGTMQNVEDRFLDDTGDSRRVVEEYVVIALECDHTITHLTRTYPSPLQQAGPRRQLPDPFAEEDRC